jgi:hypothetical protein
MNTCGGGHRRGRTDTGGGRDQHATEGERAQGRGDPVSCVRSSSDVTPPTYAATLPPPWLTASASRPTPGHSPDGPTHFRCAAPQVAGRRSTLTVIVSQEGGPMIEISLLGTTEVEVEQVVSRRHLGGRLRQVLRDPGAERRKSVPRRSWPTTSGKAHRRRPTWALESYVSCCGSARPGRWSALGAVHP